jgi:hypothetical protein
MGFCGTQPVYRVTNTLALGKFISLCSILYVLNYEFLLFVVDREGNRVVDFEVHWPALFPNIFKPICESVQLDVTVRTSVRINSIYVEEQHIITSDDDDDDENHTEKAKYMLMWAFVLDIIRWLE